MRQLKSILLAASLLMAGAASAQQYHLNVLYEATGPVSQIVTNTENPYFSAAAPIPGLELGKVTFQENGKLKMEMMTYDADGYPIGFGTNMGKTYTTFRVTYDDARHPVQLFFDGNTQKDGVSRQFTIQTAYEGDRVAMRRFFASPDGEQLLCVYSDEVADEHGNWISRRVSEVTVSDDDADVKSEKEYTETREISYF